MKRLFAILLLCVPMLMQAQERSYSTANKTAIKQYTRARQSIDAQQYDEAITQLKLALEMEPNFLEAHNSIADLLRLKKQYKASIEHYLKIIAINPQFNRAVYYNLGDEEVNIADYTNALTHLQTYLSYPAITPEKRQYTEHLIADCKFSIEAIKHPMPFKPINLGPEVNSSYDEYFPVVTADEGELIFTRKIKNNEDFYHSAKVKGKWAGATYLSEYINSPQYNEGAQAITQDGEYIFFTCCDRPSGLGSCDIYVAKKNGDSWDTPFNLNTPVNSNAWESQPSISADGQTLYFSSNRKGGYGGYDIWKSTLTDKGWGTPENLGPNVNTPFDEQSPFIHPDDNTLYFSSDGWPGFGNMDLFISRRGTDGAWQKPLNLGYPINTSADDSGLSLNANGNFAFFASNNLKGYGGFDIYTFEMPVSLRPKLVTYVKGTVKDAKSQTPIAATVEIIDLANSRMVYQNTLNEQGHFMATLTSGKNYMLNISKQGYMFYSENFSLAGDTSKKQFLIDVPLQVIEAGNKVVLKNIFFDTNKFDIKAESKIEMQKLIIFLAENPKVNIEISGHTDNAGNDVLNQTLSQNRAKEVYQYLLSQGVPQNRLTYKGYGKSQPIAPNTTEDGRRQNRRTEFKIISN
ncbi:OmpA family protein [Mucilaginibacter sp. HMF5004]|uniref:OmpA family protein n=1 Tax=Mucilaginibacter rivuli TaxID=2857527 RepID=UPI001C5F9A1B|nr:OmpA family protein [Mucilaginibacter rivuli]MBW4889511.1 OmpA family protein [Mucilaginibacter rivuli]